MNKQGILKRDGSGQGKRNNKGRGGCPNPHNRGQKADCLKREERRKGKNR